MTEATKKAGGAPRAYNRRKSNDLPWHPLKNVSRDKLLKMSRR